MGGKKVWKRSCGKKRLKENGFEQAGRSSEIFQEKRVST